MKIQCLSKQASELPPDVSSFHQATTNTRAANSTASRRRRKKFLAALAALLLLTSSRPGFASQNTPLNGSSPRPFYVIAHNPDTLADVEDALGAGANALGPDIGALDPCQPGTATPLRVMHADPCDGIGPDDLTLDAYLDGVRNLVVTKFPNLALIAFDIKPTAANPVRGEQILDSIRNHLNTNGVQIPVLLSVAKTNEAGVFDNILGKLGPLEGVMVDEEDNADEIVKVFFQKNYFGNIGYGDGTMFPGPNLPRALDKGAWLRAATGYPRSVAYVFTLNHLSSYHSFIDGGVDGIIPDQFSSSSHYGGSSYIKDLLGVVDLHKEIRLATPTDNPFQPALECYGLEIVTSDFADAGTDADITFTLKGCLGVSSNTVNTGEIYTFYDTARMRSGKTDWTTMPSKDLGTLQSITIHNDGVIQDGWNLKEIRVSSARYLGPNWYHAREYVASFNDNLIGVGKTVTIPLVPSFAEPLPTIQCPAPITVANDPNQCGAVVTFAPVVDGPCNDVTAVCAPASGTLFPVGQTIVTCYATNATKGSAPCTFTVTVQDTQLPVIVCPAPIVAKATSPAGVAVSFAPTASDNCPGATVSSVPASGSVFAIGDTTVYCTATDASANQSSCSFNVHVKGAAEQTADLLAAVNSLNLSKAGVKNALLFQLNSTLASLQSNNLVAACGSLKSFIDLVEAQRNKTISSSDADALILAANQIRAVIGCTP
jgi:hypothetical protein